MLVCTIKYNLNRSKFIKSAFHHHETHYGDEPVNILLCLCGILFLGWRSSSLFRFNKFDFGKGS